MKQWKPIPGYEGNYEISNHGGIKSIDRITPQGNFISGRDMKLNKRGSYLGIGLRNRGNKLFYVHRLVAKVFIPNPENKPQVNHINGIKRDNRVQNLEWVTAKENTNHAWDIKLNKVTIKCNALLVFDVQCGIFYESLGELARQNSTSKTVLGRIIRRNRCNARYIFV